MLGTSRILLESPITVRRENSQADVAQVGALACVNYATQKLQSKDYWPRLTSLRPGLFARPLTKEYRREHIRKESIFMKNGVY